MRFKQKAIRFTLGAILAATSVSAVSCTPICIPSGKKASLERRLDSSAYSDYSGYIIGFEGMQPFSGYKIKNLIEEISSNVNTLGCATSGNVSTHLHFIKKAYKNNIPIYIIGYSSGANDARRLAHKCKKRDIPIETLFLLDPTYLDRPFPGEIPSNVKRVINYRSSASQFVKGRPLTLDSLENPLTSFGNYDISHISHDDLPSYVSENIEINILMNQQNK